MGKNGLAVPFLRSFDRLLKAKGKMSASLVVIFGGYLLQRGGHSMFNENFRVGGKPVMECVDYHWILRFCERNNFVVRRQTGRKK